MLHGITPAQVDETEVWKLAAALGQADRPDGVQAPSGTADGYIDPWTDTVAAAIRENRPVEMSRLRALGLPIPPPPPSPVQALLSSPPPRVG